MTYEECYRERMVAIFNEWARQYEEDPESFDTPSTEGGDYGETCADFFDKIAEELDEKGVLPLMEDAHPGCGT